jgi:nitrous oxide reductase accessory protein NosL
VHIIFGEEKMNRLFLIIVAAFLLCIPQLTYAGNGRASCKVCGMYIDLYHDTSAELTTKNGEKFETCGVACMLRVVNDEGGPKAFSTIMVHDWKRKVLIPAEDATYVIGSKIVPDMTPTIIAFEKKADAEDFRLKEGGEIINFTQALLSISPMGMTMPTRIQTAVLPPKGAFGAGVNYMHMTMDRVMLGSDSVDPLDFVQRPGQMMGPKKMTSDGEMLMVNYSITDNLALGVSTPYLDKKMEMYTMGGKATQTYKNSGFGDIGLSLRYNLWKNVYYSKFFSLLAETTLPTGDFKGKYISMPGLQTGAGAFSFTGGLLFSHRYKDFWFHYLTSYTARFENGDDYRFGDTARIGAAVHYTPNYDLMSGLELDATYAAKNKYMGSNVGNTGGFVTNLTGVVDWKFITAFGGNFSVRVTAGLPIYQDLNDYSTGTSEKAQLGGGYFGSAMISFKRRFPVF